MGIFNRKKVTFEDYKDKWVVVGMKNGNSEAGQISYIDNKNIGLLPYQSFSHKGENKYTIVESGLPLLLDRGGVGLLRETSMEGIEEFCKYMNNRYYIESLENNLKKYNLEMQSKKTNIGFKS